MADTVTWGAHQFGVYQHGASWSAVAGLDIFAGKNSEGRWVALYIGQAESLAERLPTHERWSEAARLGATHVHAKVESLAATRDAVERQLIQAFQPRLNTQHR
jgi:hypothetical protein